MSRREDALVAALGALAVVLAALWLRGADLPLGGRDEFMVLEVATQVGLRVIDGDWTGAWRDVREAYYPPLIRLPALIALWLGGGWRAMVAAGWLVWVPALLVGTRAAARHAGGSAAWAVGLLLPGVGVLDALHHLEPNLPQLGATALALLAWLRSDDLRDRRGAVWFGVAVGVGLLSERLGTAPFAVVPALLSAIRGGARARRGAAIAAAVAGAIALPWYVFYVGDIVQTVLPQLGAGELDAVGNAVEEPVPWPWWPLVVLLYLPDAQLGPVGGAIGLAALAWALARARRRPIADLLAWVLPALLAFTLIAKRQPYYTLPILPALCALAAAMASRWPAALRGAALVACWLPAVTSWRVEAPDLDDLPAWIVLGRSPLPSSVVGERFPVGDPPRPEGLDVPALLAATEGALPATVFALHTTVAESYLVSLGRLALRSNALTGATLHGHDREPRAVLTVFDDERWPGCAGLRAAYAARQYDPPEDGVCAWFETLAGRVTPVARQPLRTGGVATAWRVR